MMASNSMEYKKRIIKTWNEIAPRYHNRWARGDVGPFKSTSELVSMAGIKSGDHVLDLACGTGVVTKRILLKVGPRGHVVGVDSSSTAIRIAKKWTKMKNLDLVIADAEHIDFNKKFDAVTCQYAIFFFPNTQKALQNAKRCLKKCGTIALSVHGSGSSVPFFSSILDVVPKFIPDYVPAGPSFDRFGTREELRRAAARAGFSSIKIRQFQFEYSPGTFSNYWSNYMRYLATPLKQKIRKLTGAQLAQMREQIKQNTIPYTRRDGKIVFPWKVLILTAKKP
ncbi:class I SAM-dependent methyltransferase [Candidatus Nitrosotenuis cloacae]|uniref:class I SAM-dependent methyltransferase n=1 Tax=Candidatus Nitrosotenuis cloacae TaxID=1603555 RepID=UPI00227F5C60|nr:methyltransferase domain-containing protein [Candidatus Nitrosotenuis cloacae]